MAPELLSYNIQTGSIFSVCWSLCKPFTCHWLQSWLCTYPMTYLCQKFSSVISILLCRIEGKPPQEQLRACSIVNFWSQTQRDGSCSGCQPYLKHRASQNAPLWRVNPWSAIRRVVGYVEAPFSDDTSITLCRLVGCLLAISFASALSLYLCLVRAR